MNVFLMGDVDAIKDYVFEAPGLPQIRGGSQRLVECEDQVRRYVIQQGGKEIYCSGGGFLFEVPVDKAEEIKRGIKDIYLRHTQMATVTIVYEDTPEALPPAPDIADGWAGRLVKAYQEAQQAGEFARRTAFLAARLRQAKVRKTTVPFIEAFPFGKRCDVCGKRVAEKEVSYPDEIKRVCGVCYRRHETGKRERKVWFERFTDSLKLDLKPHAPHDLNELVGSARRSYVAFLYADGNNIGGLLQQVKDDQEFEALSYGLREGTKRALFEALWEICWPVLEKEQVWPFEILNIGGDDVTIFIQAGYAWEVAIAFLERFQTYVREEVEKRLKHWPENWPDTITASVGIAIADAKHPVRYLEALATDLLKQAKKVAKETDTSVIDFLWHPNPIAATRIETVVHLYQRDMSVLTARPYTLGRARAIQQVVEALSSWPRSLRHRWGETLERGVWPSLSLIVYDLARRPTEKRKAMLDRFRNLLPPNASSKIHPPVWWWDKTEKKYRTALLDALELAELRAMRPDVQEEGE